MKAAQLELSRTLDVPLCGWTPGLGPVALRNTAGRPVRKELSFLEQHQLMNTMNLRKPLLCEVFPKYPWRQLGVRNQT